MGVGGGVGAADLCTHGVFGTDLCANRPHGIAGACEDGLVQGVLAGQPQAYRDRRTKHLLYNTTVQYEGCNSD